MMNMLADLQSFFAVYPEKWSSWSPDILRAIRTTLWITAGSFLLGLVIGLFLAIARLSKSAMIRNAATVYVEIARGVPALVVLFLIYFGLPPLGIAFDAIPSAILGLGLSSGGYFAEIFRAGIIATHRGQREAGHAVGMTPFQIYRFIIIPQATRIALPPLVNMLITLLKDSSLASLISAPEIMLRAKDISSTDFLPLHILVLAGVIYLAMAVPLSLLARVIERRMFAGLGARL